MVQISPSWLGVKGLDMLRPKIAAILPHVPLGNILAIVSCACRLHPRPKVGRVDLRLGVEQILEGLARVSPEGAGTRVSRIAAKYARNAAYGTTGARPRNWSGGPGHAESERRRPFLAIPFRPWLATSERSAKGTVTRGGAGSLDALVTEPGYSRAGCW